MTNQEKGLSFTFENPNTTAAFEAAFRMIVIEKLAAQGKQEDMRRKP